MAIAMSEEERLRDQMETAARKWHLELEEKKIKEKFGDDEIGLAVIAYLYPEKLPKTDAEFDLRRIAFAATLSVLATGSREEIQKCIEIFLWLSEETTKQFERRIDILESHSIY